MKSLLALLACTGVASAEEVDRVETKAPPRPLFSIHRVYFRAGVAHMAPQVKSDEMELAGVEGPASLSVHDGPIAGSGATINAQTIPVAILGYRLPWLGERLAWETIVGAPLEVKFTATGTLRDESVAPNALGNVPTGVMALGPELGTAKAIPPVVTMTYAFLDRARAVVPYLGLGASVLIAYDAKITNPTLVAAGEPTLHIDPAYGFVMQAGLDVKIYKSVRARVDVKYIAGMVAHARVEHVAMNTPDLPLFERVEVGEARMTMTVNPLLVQGGIGVDF